MPEFFCLSGPDMGRSFEVDDGALFGRAPECRVRLRDKSISRQHARLERDGDRWRLVDAGSRNGVFVDDERVVHVGGDLYLAASAVERARAALVASFERHGHLEIPELRDELGTTRKFLIPLLEWFDAQGVTMRQGPHRVLRKR